MTGYATVTRETATGTLTLEIRSVNSRFLDLQFRINDDLRSAEPALREAIMARVARGKVECRLSFGRKASSTAATELNTVLLNSLSALQDQVRQRFADAAPLSVGELLRWPGMMSETDADTLAAGPQASASAQIAQHDEILGAANEAVSEFTASRQREGAALAEMLLARVTDMEAIVERIAPLVPLALWQMQLKAVERLQDALGMAQAESGNAKPIIPVEEVSERIRQEVTLYAVRIDVQEELTRLAAHLTETRRIITEGGRVGKRLDFMMQELNREANTVGSKAAVRELSDASMEMKLLIEQMREQVQNLE
ncbi:MAG: YicC/YloC family endoribonuclease [Janthinobacterium lividum]